MIMPWCGGVNSIIVCAGNVVLNICYDLCETANSDDNTKNKRKSHPTSIRAPSRFRLFFALTEQLFAQQTQILMEVPRPMCAVFMLPFRFFFFVGRRFHQRRASNSRLR